MIPPIVLASILGLRREEVLGLKFSDIDFEHHRISVSSTIVKVNGISSALYRKTTKTKTSRSFIPLSKNLETFLLSVKESQDEMRKILGDSYDNHT